MVASTKSSRKLKKIFISYPHKTSAHVALIQQVRNVLEQRGYSTWLDGDELKVGDDWRSRILEGLMETDFVLAFLSKHSMRDPGVCRNEISLALHEKSSDDVLMTALLEDEGMTHAPLTLAHIQPVDLTDFETLSLGLKTPKGIKKLELAVDQIVQKMENGKDVAGNMTILRRRLQPASYIAEIAQKSFAFEGRKWFFEEMQIWQKDFYAPRVFALQGSAGVGKSAISAHLSNYRGSVFGIHFCKYNDVSTHSTNNLVRTMAFQLASRHKVYAAKLIHTLADDKYSDDKLFNILGDQLFDELIIALTATLDVVDDERKIFIVDGLDEATVKSKNAILDLIRTKFPALPNWLGVFVTSRPEANVVEALPNSYILNADDKRNQADVRNYLSKALKKVDALAQNESVLDKALDVAAERAAGVMLYASELLRALREGYINPLQPDEFPNSLGGLYFLSLQRHYPNREQYYHGKPAVADLLELIAGSPLPITERLLLGIANINRDALTEALAPLHTLLVRKAKPSEHTESIELFHKSFSDWLLEEHPYELNGDGAQTIGEFLYITFKSIEDQDPNKASSEYLGDIDTLLPLCLPTMAAWCEVSDLKALWNWFYGRGRYRAAFVPIDRVVDINKETLGTKHLDTLVSINSLASTFSKQGELARALKLLEHSLVTLKETLGENHHETLTAMNNLASTLRQQGQLEKARAMQGKVLAALSKENISSEQHNARLLLIGISNLALTFSELGDFDSAVEIGCDIIEMFEKVAGNAHPDTLTAMNNLALALRKAGDLKSALKLQNQVLEGQVASLGWTHPDTLISLDNLGGTLYAQGDFERANFIQNLALKTLQEQLGNKHPSTLTSMGSLALTLFKQENFGGARQLQEHVLTKLTETLGLNHPKTLLAMSNLAITLHKQKNFDAACEFQQQALEVSEEILGNKHPETLNFMLLLAIMYLEQGKSAEGVKLFERAIQGYKKTHGEAHNKTADLVNNLVTLLIAHGDYLGAREHLKQTIAACKSNLGETNPATLKCISKLAFTLCEQKDFTAAVKLLKQTLASCKKNLGEADTETLTIMNNLGHTFYKQGDFSKARELQEDMLEIRRLNLGKDHSDTLTSMLNLVHTLSAQGDLIGGRKLQEELLAIYKTLMHPNQPKILECKLNIGNLSLQMKEYAYGLKYLTELREQIEPYLEDDAAQKLRAMNEYLADAVAEGNENMEEMYLTLVQNLLHVVKFLKEQRE